MIKALLGGLILNMVLVALFPSAFLKDEARWTYQSDVGRVDVAFAGDVSDGQIEVHGKELRVERARWIRDAKGNQGVVVQFPISYLRKNYQIALMPQGNAKDISLVMNFRGQDLRAGKQNKPPAYVRFENIRVNGKKVAEDQTVWHDKPFKYILKQIPNNSDVILSYDVRKPISFSDIRWDRVIGLLFLCMLFVFFSYDTIRRLVQNIIGQKEVILSDIGSFLKLHKRKFLISIILTLLANIFCLPLWTEYDYGSFIWTLFNKEARLDLVYSGKLTGTEPFLLKSVSQPVTTTYWYEPETGNSRRANLNLRASGEWQKLFFQVDPLQDGKITVLLRGPNAHNDYNESFAALTDWRKLKINGKVIFTEPRTFSYLGNEAKFIPGKKYELPRCDYDLMFADPRNFPYVGKHAQSVPVKKHGLIDIEVEFRRHPISVHDFTLLKSGKIWYFITGNLLFFFLTYRLLSYIRGGGTKRNDSFLLAIFFLILFVPMISISDGVVSVRGNSTLAVKPVLKDIFKEKSDYGRRYENWFNDHFCGHVALTRLHDVLRNELSHVICAKKAIYFKKDDWLFMKPLVFEWNDNPTFARSIVQNILKMNQFCQQNQIKLYILEVPRKQSVYKEFLSDEYGFNEKQFVKVSRAQEAIRSEVLDHHIPWVYPYEALRNASKQDFVFFKYSHHWTDWGAFVGYRELMKEVGRDYPDIPIASLGDYSRSQNQLIRDDWSRNYHSGYLYRFCNLQKRHQHPCFNYYDHKNADKMEVRVGKCTKDFAYPEGKHKIMLIGTSQNENLLQFLPYSASQTKYIRLNVGQVRGVDAFKVIKLYKKDILAFKPEILILSIHSNNLPQLRDLFSTK